jgi:hypothetical protein
MTFEKSNHGIAKTFIPFGGDFIWLSVTQHFLSQTKAFLATLACVTRAHALCSTRFWMSPNTAPTRYDSVLPEAGKSVRFATLARFFLRLSTQTKVCQGVTVHNADIARGGMFFPCTSIAGEPRASCAGMR